MEIDVDAASTTRNRVEFIKVTCWSAVTWLAARLFKSDLKKYLPDQIYNAANSFHLLRLQHNKSDKYASTKPFPSFTR